MELSQIITELDQEITRLQQARALLSGNSHSLKPPRKKRMLSAEAKRRIAEAQRKRWAKVKKAGQ